MNAVINKINVNFSVTDERVFIGSLELSEVFGKEHRHVLRTISKLPDDEFKSSNFAKHSYIDKIGRILPCYALTRDGFSLLVMGFTGQKAYQWKIEFIKAFNTMEAKLKRQSVSHYVDKIASLEAVRISQNAYHHRQILGYKSPNFTA
jgi:phage regulatory protein, rha family